MQEWQVLAAWGIPDVARVAHPPRTVPVPQRVSGWKGAGTSRRGSPRSRDMPEGLGWECGT